MISLTELLVCLSTVYLLCYYFVNNFLITLFLSHLNLSWELDKYRNRHFAETCKQFIVPLSSLEFWQYMHHNIQMMYIIVGSVFKLEHRSVFCFIHLFFFFSFYNFCVCDRKRREKKRGPRSAGTLSHAGDGGWDCVMPVSVWRQHTEGMVCVCEC